MIKFQVGDNSSIEKKTSKIIQNKHRRSVIRTYGPLIWITIRFCRYDFLKRIIVARFVFVKRMIYVPLLSSVWVLSLFRNNFICVFETLTIVVSKWEVVCSKEKRYICEENVVSDESFLTQAYI